MNKIAILGLKAQKAPLLVVQTHPVTSLNTSINKNPVHN